MQTLISLAEVVQATQSVQPHLQESGDVLMAAPTGDKLANTIRNFIAPLFLLGIGIVALRFLSQQQITQFLMFFVITIAVGVFFYAPGFVEPLARAVSKTLN